MEKRLNIFADGGNRNTGVFKGGHVSNNDLSAWAYLIEIDNHKFFDSDVVLGSTNNAMEISAVGFAFNFIKQHSEWDDYKINLILDSKYVLDSLQKGWLNNWILKKDTKRPNFVLWKNLYPLFKSLEDRIEYQWVKGHSNNAGNIFVDELLNKTMDEYKK
jgi:ribonuclease HI